MKFSPNFERDYNWYFKYRHIFNFDGTADTGDKVVHSEKWGRTAKECFYLFDSRGKIEPTIEPELLYDIHKCKGSINFNIKMWAEEWGKGRMGGIEFYETIVTEYELLDWMIKATENQLMKWWGTNWGL